MSRARNLSKFKPASTGLIEAANITSGTITNTQINASAAIAATKLGTMATANMPAGSILQVQHVIYSTSASFAATTSTGHDILDKTVTTKKANSTFYVHWSICHGIGGEENNMDSHDMHFFCVRTASSTDTNVGGNTDLTRNSAGSGTGGNRLYSTDVPMAPSRGLTPAYGNTLDVFHRSGHFLDSPSLGAGVTNRYRIRMFNQSTVYLNRGRTDGANSGGASSLVIMEVAV